MKVGTSFSRCVKDIWDGKVDSHEVMVIIARTHVNPNNDHEWDAIWQGYHAGGAWSNPEWTDIDQKDEADFRHLCTELYNAGMVHQPRIFGAHPRRLAHHWYEVILTDETHETNPTLKEAFGQYKTIAGLVS